MTIDEALAVLRAHECPGRPPSAEDRYSEALNTLELHIHELREAWREWLPTPAVFPSDRALDSLWAMGVAAPEDDA